MLSFCRSHYWQRVFEHRNWHSRWDWALFFNPISCLLQRLMPDASEKGAKNPIISQSCLKPWSRMLNVNLEELLTFSYPCKISPHFSWFYAFVASIKSYSNKFCILSHTLTWQFFVSLQVSHVFIKNNIFLFRDLNVCGYFMIPCQSFIVFRDFHHTPLLPDEARWSSVSYHHFYVWEVFCMPWNSWSPFLETTFYYGLSQTARLTQPSRNCTCQLT